MNILLGFMLFSLVGIIVSFIAYTAITNSIIKTQERQIGKLTEDNTRLRQANAKLKTALDSAEKPQVYNIYTEGYQKSLKDSAKGLKFGE